uniref:RNA-directed RNA polymerase n=1 Tax=Crocidura shantungensis ribovirus 14 TaxID=3139534 RepID=A0AB38ZJU3_9VIRU
MMNSQKTKNSDVAQFLPHNYIHFLNQAFSSYGDDNIAAQFNPYWNVPNLQTLAFDCSDYNGPILPFDLTPLQNLITDECELVEESDFFSSLPYEFTRDWFINMQSKQSRGEFICGNFRTIRYIIPCSRKWLYHLHKNSYNKDLNILDYPIYEPDLGFLKLLLSGDVEENPGPVQSKLTQHSNQIIKFQERMAHLENARKKKIIKEKQMRREIRRQKRNIDYASLENHGLEDFVRKATGIEKDRVRDTLEGVCKAASSVDDVINQMKENLPTLASKHAVLTDHATRAFDMITQFMSKMNGLSDKIEGYFSLAKKKIGNLSYLQVIASILTLIAVCTLPKKYKIFPMVLAVMYLMGWSSQVVDKIKELFTRQQNHSFETYIPLIGQCIFTMLAFIGVKAIPSDRYYTELLRRLDLIPKACTGVSKIWEQAGSIFNVVSTEFQVYVMHKERPDLSICEQRVVAVNELVCEVEKWNEIENRKLLANDADAVKAVVDLQERLNHWMHSTTKWQAFTPEQKRVLLSIRPVVLDLYKLASKSSVFEGGFRNIPLAILLTGGTGLGKSRLLDPLSFALLNHRKIPAAQIKDNVYVRASETEFWDGYHGQKLVQVDEFGQVRDTVSKPNVDMMEAMRMINNAPYPVHMAELTDKGQHFVSEVVIFASNISHAMIKHINSLVFPKAAIRRLNVNAYRLVVKPDFQEVVCSREILTNDLPLYDPSKYTHEGMCERNGVSYVNLVWKELKHPYCKFQGGEWTIDPEKVGYNPATPEKGCKECKILYENTQIYQEIGSVEFCKHHYCFERYDVFTDEVIESNIGFDEFLQQVMSKDQKVQASQTNLLKTYEAFQMNPDLLVNHGEEFEDALTGDEQMWIEMHTPKMLHQVGAVDLANPFDYANFMFYQAFHNVMQQVHGRSYTLDIENQHLANMPILESMYDRINFCGFVNREESEYRSEIWDEVKNSMYFDSLFKSFIRKNETCFERLKYTAKSRLREFYHNLNEWWLAREFSDLFSITSSVIALIGLGALVYGITQQNVKICYSCSKPVNECVCKQELKELQELLMLKKVYNVDYDKFLEMLPQCENSGEIRIQKCVSQKVESSGEVKVQKIVQQVAENSGEVKIQKMVQQKAENSGEIRIQKSVQQKPESSGEIKIQKQVPQQVESYLEMSHCLDEQENEGIPDLNAHNIVTKLLRQSIYMMHTNDTPIGNVMFITGRVLLMPYHYFTRYIKFQSLKTELHLSNISGRNLVTFPVSVVHDFIRLEKNGEPQDAVLVVLDNIKCKVSHHANIVNAFMPKSNVSALSINGTYNGVVPVISDVLESGTSLSDRTSQLGYSLLPASRIKGHFDKNSAFDIRQTDDTILTYRQYYSYDIYSVPGNCGSPLVIYNNSVSHKLLGIHVTGSSQGFGTCQIITQEMLQEGLTKVHRDAQCCVQVDGVEPIDLDTIRVNDVPCEGLIVHGKLPHRASTGNTTKIIPSVLHGKLSTPKTKPTFGESLKGKDAMYKGLVKYTANPPRLTPNLIKIAATDVNNLMHTNWANKDASNYMRVLTYEESVLGTDDPYISALNRKSSCGYPWTVKYPHLNGKKQAFGSDEWTLDSPLSKEIEQAVYDLEQKCLDGIQTDVLWTDTLKDERRPIEKVDIGKIRVFCAGPVHFTILFRMYFLGFAAWTMHSRNINGVSTGTNVFSPDWDIIAKKLLCKGKNIVAGDFSNFDGTLNQQILWALFDLIDAYYAEFETEEQYNRNHKIRYVLWMHIAQACHLCVNVVYMVTHCQPSGCPLTAILNSWYFLLLCRIVFLLCAMVRESELMCRVGTLANMDLYNKCVAEVSYGDDNVVAVHDSIVEWFNQETMTVAFLACGHVYTDEAKSGIQYISRDLNEIAYLKRKFLFDDTSYRYIAPLDLDVILEIPQWTKKGSLAESILFGNIDITLRELSLHGEEIFDKYQKVIQKECLAANINYPFRAFSEYKCDVLEIDNWQLNESSKPWLLHCVSADFALRKGFAAELLKQRPEAIKHVEKMRKQPIKIGYIAIDNRAHVIHMVTKLKASDKPTSNSGFLTCLNNLNSFYFAEPIYCPMIGCGLDGRVNGMSSWTRTQLQDCINAYCPNLVIKVQGSDVIFQNEENSESLINLNCYQDNETCFLALPPKMSRGSPTLSREPRCEIIV